MVKASTMDLLREICRLGQGEIPEHKLLHNLDICHGYFCKLRKQLTDAGRLLVTHPNRKAHYTCAIALVRPDGSVVEAEGYFHGEVGHERIGTNGFGYDPIFYVPEYGCTTAEMNPDKKNELSHRGNALRAMRKIMENKYENTNCE